MCVKYLPWATKKPIHACDRQLQRTPKQKNNALAIGRRSYYRRMSSANSLVATTALLVVLSLSPTLVRMQHNTKTYAYSPCLPAAIPNSFSTFSVDATVGSQPLVWTRR